MVDPDPGLRHDPCDVLLLPARSKARASTGSSTLAHSRLATPHGRLQGAVRRLHRSQGSKFSRILMYPIL